MAAIGLLTEFDPKVHDWVMHIGRIEQYFIANGIKTEEEGRKRAILLNGLSQEAYILLQNLRIPEKPESTSYANIKKLLSEYYVKKTVPFAERIKFYAASKSPNECTQEWAVKLKQLIAHMWKRTRLAQSTRSSALSPRQQGRSTFISDTAEEGRKPTLLDL